jgi:hypothetical protein
MAARSYRLLLIFVDGVGLAPEGPGNPLATEPMPALRALLGGAMTAERAQRRDGLLLAPLDATLGVPGLPQSATGQTALFTGVNGAALLGRHATAFPGPRLRQVIAAASLFKRAREAGRSATFANAYAGGVADETRGESRASVTTWAVRAAGLPLRGLGELARGEAVSWDVCRDRFARRAGIALGPVAASVAGGHLAALTADHDLTVYESFLTDLAGHRRFGITAREALERIDGLLQGALAGLPAEATLLLTSDHGNVEDATTRLHTRNPVPLLAVGPGAAAFAGLDSLLEVTPAILRTLAAPPS